MRPFLIRSTLLLTVTLGGGACTEHPKDTGPVIPPGQAWLTKQQITDAKIALAPTGMHGVGGAVATSGRVTFDDLHVSHVFSPVTGRITSIIAQPGQRVKKDQTLAIIQSPDVGSAFSDLAKAHADSDAAEKELRRQKELYEAHAGAQKDFESAKATAGKAKAELERSQRKANLLARGGVDNGNQDFLLRSPLDGEVVIRNVNPGAEVQGTYGGGSAVELFTIGELDKVWVMADVFEVDLAKVKEKSHVTLRVVAYPDRMFEGLVEWVSGALDPTSRTAKVRISVDNKERLLKPEMYATVLIDIDQRKAMAIPRTALLRLGDQNVVFAQVGTTPDGQLKFERRPVAVDEEQGGDYLPVTHGLNDGDVVVVSGGILLLGML